MLLLLLLLLSPVHTGNKVEFNTVDFVECRQSRPCQQQSWTYAVTVDFVADLLPVSATKSTFNTVDRVEFNFVASVYWALGNAPNIGLELVHSIVICWSLAATIMLVYTLRWDRREDMRDAWEHCLWWQVP